MLSDFRTHVLGVPQVAPRLSNMVFDGPGADEDFGLEQAAAIVNKSGATVWTVSVRSTSASSSHCENVLNTVVRSSDGSRLTIVEPTGLESML